MIELVCFTTESGDFILARDEEDAVEIYMDETGLNPSDFLPINENPEALDMLIEKGYLEEPVDWLDRGIIYEHEIW